MLLLGVPEALEADCWSQIKQGSLSETGLQEQSHGLPRWSSPLIWCPKGLQRDLERVGQPNAASSTALHPGYIYALLKKLCQAHNKGETHNSSLDLLIRKSERSLEDKRAVDVSVMRSLTCLR